MDRLRRREVFAEDGYPVAGAPIALEADVASHTHDFLEVAVVLAGAVTYLSPSGPQVLGPGAVTAVRPGGWHGYSDVREAVVGNLYLGEELLLTDLRWLLDLRGLGRFLLRGGQAPRRLDAAARTRVEGCLAELAQVRVSRSGPGVARSIGLACTVLGEVGELGFDDAPTTAGPAFSTPVRRLIELVGGQPAQPWTVPALARVIGVSPSHLHREVKSQLGLTPMAWLTRTRAELAATLLLQTDRPVGWVGRQVGWPEPNYFSRRFRHAYGMSPTTYRARNRSGAPDD